MNSIISARTKMAIKECKTIHDWVRKVINKELCKKLKFNQTIK